MQNKNKANWFSIGPAAKYLGISRDTLRRWEKRGKIKTIRSPTNRRYYTKKQLDQIMSGSSSPSKKIVNSKKKWAKKVNPTLFIISTLSFLIAVFLVLLLLQSKSW